ncbi:LysR family transcriptional regulator [Rhizobium sp. AAP43]|uniref:LysR family transcriptional regulator n=1 Tax=Rhizobium sp. AAP43 TaxID=1523420 RepID=UPI0006B99D57|nr:LysR family transcriptional regulator [Rhizobium sp. AAP43]
MDKFLLQFMAIVEAGSFVRAAETLLISQPALTYNMKKLEEGLGVRLLERSSRGIRLTEYGETLYQSGEMMRRTYSNALDRIDRQRAELDHGISIGTGYSVWILFLRDMMFEYAARHPKAPINVNIGNALRGMDQLLAGDISILVSHRIENLSREEELVFRPLGLTQDEYFAREGHVLHECPRSRAEILSWPTTIAFPPEARPRRLLRSGASTAADLPPGSAGHQFTSSSLGACIDFARATNAVLIHNNILKGHLREQGLLPIKTLPGDELRPWPMGIYTLRELRRDATIDLLLEDIARRWSGIGAQQ